MKIIFSLLLGLISSYTFGQNINVSGRVIEELNQQAIEYVAVSAFSLADSSLISGSLTDTLGNFSFLLSTTSDFYILLQFIGYEAYYSEALDHTQSHDLGTIQLGLKSISLEEVALTARNETNIHKIDKQVYEASQFETARGGTASDVLRNLPAVSMNASGEISVRGATGFWVMINGKAIQGDPSIVLQQLPANAIDDIEIVTAPSAKYDPDGKAGIINIKTRQAVLDGKYFVANVLMGLPSIEPYDNAQNSPRYGADVIFNYKQKKWDFSIGGDYRRYDISGRREGYVNTYLNEVLTEFPSDGERSFDEETFSGRAIIGFNPNSRQRIQAGIYAGKRTKDRTADILYLNQQRTIIPSAEYQGAGRYFELYENNGTVFRNGQILNSFTYFNENLRVRKGDFIVGSLDYSLNFSDKSTLSISGLYERTILGGPTDNANLAYPNTQNVLQLQFNDNDNPLDGYRFQIDYAKTIGDLRWESGYQYRFLQHPGDFIYLDRNLVENSWEENPLFTNTIDLSRKIHALYTQFSGKHQRWSYTAGLRLENFDRTVEIARPASTFELNRWNLFPSLNLSYALSEDLLLKAAYSRRIERTTTFKMTPFPEREHSETLEQGDAELLPEYIDLLELGLVKNWGDHSIFATAYMRNIEDVINRVNTVFNDTILNRIYTNAGDAQAIGLELGATFYPAKNWRITIGGNVYNYGIEGELFGEKINTSNTIFSINANTLIDISPSLSGQLAFNYLSERVTAQGRDSEFYNPSLSIRKSFMNNKVSIGLQWLNIDLGLWNANEQRITTERSNFFTTTNYVYEVDIVQFTFTYRLNQASNKLKGPESEFGKKEF